MAEPVGEPTVTRDLAIGEFEYLILPAGTFTQEGDWPVWVRVFCDDDPLPPVEVVVTMRVVPHEFPEVLDG